MSGDAKRGFPPSNGGADFVQDPSSTHFSDAPIPKLVREVVQNSLDAKDNNLPKPVTVKFTETSISRDIIGAFVGDCLGRPRGLGIVFGDDRRGDQLLANLGQTRLRTAGKLSGGCEQDRLRRRIPVEGSQQLSDARQGDELMAVEVAGECLQTQTILRRLGRVGGKFSLDDMLRLRHLQQGASSVPALSTTRAPAGYCSRASTSDIQPEFISERNLQ